MPARLIEHDRLREAGILREPLEPVRRRGRAPTPPSRISSAIARPTAGDCMNPCPENPQAAYTPSPTRPRIGWASGVMSYSRPTPRRSGSARGGREAVREPREPIGEHRLVDGRLEAPARLRRRPSRARAGRRGGGNGSRVSASTTIGSIAGDDGSGSVASSCRQSGRIGQLDAELERRAPPTTARRRSRACRPRRAGSPRAVCSRTSTPSSPAPADELRASPRAGRRRRPARRTPRRARRSSRARATNDGSTRSTGTPSPACSSRRSSSAASPSSVVARNSSRPGGRTARRAPRRTRCSPARAAPRPRSRTAGARRPSRATVDPDAISPRSQRTTSPAPRERQAVCDARRPSPRAPATRITAASSSSSSAALSERSGARTSGRDRHARAAPATTFAAAWNGNRSSSRAQPLGLVARAPASARGRAPPRPPG